MNFIKLIIISVALMYSLPSFAQNARILELDYFGLEYRRTIDKRDPFLPEYTTIEGECAGHTLDGEKSRECWKYGANAKFDFTVFEYGEYLDLFWRNDVPMDVTNKQVRQVGWRWEVGFDLGKFELKHRHFSGHVLDTTSEQKFKLENEVVVSYDMYGTRGK